MSYSIQGVAFRKLNANAVFQIPEHVRLLKSKSHTHEAASLTAPPDLAILSLLYVWGCLLWGCVEMDPFTGTPS